jgi:hypothetical protein
MKEQLIEKRESIKEKEHIQSTYTKRDYSDLPPEEY